MRFWATATLVLQNTAGSEGAQSIDLVVSSTNITSVLGSRISASQVTESSSLERPKIFISVIGTVACAVPVTLPAFSEKLRSWAKVSVAVP